MLNTQLFQYFGKLWAKNSNKTNNNAEQGEYVLFKLGMLAILFCYRQTEIIQLEAKTDVALECEFVCHIARLTQSLFFRNILVDFDYKMRKQPPKFINLQRIFVVMFIPVLSLDHATPKKAS